MQGIAYIYDGEARIVWPVERGLLDEDGNPAGEVSSNLDTLLAALPEGAEYTLITEEEAQVWWNAQRSLAESRADKRTEINAACSSALASLTAPYPQAELLTFDKQEAEARAWLADNTAPTPLLSALAAGRGIPLDELAGRIIAKADAFAAVSGFVIGQRQALEDALNACADAEAVRSLTVTYALPGQEGNAA